MCRYRSAQRLQMLKHKHDLFCCTAAKLRITNEYGERYCNCQLEMSALVLVIQSPQSVIGHWEIGRVPNTKGDDDNARGSASAFKDLLKGI
jgi:hypothetical protein